MIEYTVMNILIGLEERPPRDEDGFLLSPDDAVMTGRGRDGGLTVSGSEAEQREAEREEGAEVSERPVNYNERQQKTAHSTQIDTPS